LQYNYTKLEYANLQTEIQQFINLTDSRKTDLTPYEKQCQQINLEIVRDKASNIHVSYKEMD